MVCSETRRWRSHVRSQVRSGLSQTLYCRIRERGVKRGARSSIDALMRAA